MSMNFLAAAKAPPPSAGEAAENKGALAFRRRAQLRGGTHRGVRAAGPRAGGVRIGSVGLQRRVEALLLSPQQRLQGLDVADGVAQELHLGQPLVGVRGGAPLQRLQAVVDFAQPAPLPHGGRLPPVGVGGLPLAGLAGPEQAAARLVEAPRRPHVLLHHRLLLQLLLCAGNVVMEVLVAFCFQQEASVQLIEEGQVSAAEAGVIVEVIGREREGQLGQIHRVTKGRGGGGGEGGGLPGNLLWSATPVQRVLNSRKDDRSNSGQSGTSEDENV